MMSFHSDRTLINGCKRGFPWPSIERHEISRVSFRQLSRCVRRATCRFMSTISGSGSVRRGFQAAGSPRSLHPGLKSRLRAQDVHWIKSTVWSCATSSRSASSGTSMMRGTIRTSPASKGPFSVRSPEIGLLGPMRIAGSARSCFCRVLLGKKWILSWTTVISFEVMTFEISANSGAIAFSSSRFRME